MHPEKPKRLLILNQKCYGFVPMAVFYSSQNCDCVGKATLMFHVFCSRRAIDDIWPFVMADGNSQPVPCILPVHKQ